MAEIQRIAVNWNHGYMNAPELEVWVDDKPPQDSFEYMVLKTDVRVSELSHEQEVAVNFGIPLPVGALKTEAPIVTNVTNDPTLQSWREEGNIFLLSVNNAPWIRYVKIADPKGSPTSHGALGGEYKLTDGTTFRSRTGWSSSASAVNATFKQFVPEYSGIVDVTVVIALSDEDKARHRVYPQRWAGYAITVDYLDELYRTSELWPTWAGNKVNMVPIKNVWMPSIDSNPGTKPPASRTGR